MDAHQIPDQQSCSERETQVHLGALILQKKLLAETHKVHMI